ncbi:hypothetical protein M2189_003345 [Bradyrhizobium japonicum]|nr:hypothetical protein [Bradyrhizobium japonicum]MCS3960142.1 hypothetical protein [Bradyrhizobium japonicum]MCS4001895.1 hypothetical protein [Bradyrhizobium japonicum]
MNALARRSWSTNVVQIAQKEARRYGLLQNVVLNAAIGLYLLLERPPSLGQ